MNDDVISRLGDSAHDFERVVWPLIHARNWLGGGSIVPVESVTSREFNKELDMLSGIDAWHLLRNENAIRGIASRVQPVRAGGKRWDTFTIRYSLPSGQPTEYHKRLHALNNIDRGFLLPHVTVHAYTTAPARHGHLLSAALVRTVTLFRLAEKLVNGGKRGERDRWGFRPVGSGESLLWISWDMFARPDLKVWRIEDEQAREMAGRTAP